MKKQFLVLTHYGMLVDKMMLYKGIYEVSVPELYTMDTTIDELIDRYKELDKYLPLGNSFYENLRKCTLSPIDLIMLPNNNGN